MMRFLGYRNGVNENTGTILILRRMNSEKNPIGSKILSESYVFFSS